VGEVFPFALSLLIALPLVGGFAIMALLGKPERAHLSKYAALGISLSELGLGLYITYDFIANGLYANGLWDLAYAEQGSWIPTLGVTYQVGLDGLSFAMVLLNVVIFPPAILFAFSEKQGLNKFFGLLLAMEGAINGVFLAQDFFLFYIFWEAVLVPMFFLIHLWGGTNRRYAAMKFFLYTHVGSVVMFVGFLYMSLQYASATGVFTFDMVVIGKYAPLFTPAVQSSFAFILVFFGFAVKMPSFPFHTWLPDAHVQAPTAGSVILAALLLKMGGYGLIRIGVTMLPEGAAAWVPLMAALGVISMVYGALVCLRADDLKRMIAVSSVSHMGFVTLGIATLTDAGIQAAIFQMFAHGLISAMLFMMAGAIGHNLGTRNVSQLGGINKRVPRIGAFTMFAFLASLGLPFLVGFAAEFAVFIAANGTFGYWVALPIVTVFFTAAYYVWGYQRAAQGPLRPEFDRKDIHDLKPFELTALGTLAALVVLFGCLPFLLMDYIGPFSSLLGAALGVGP
jgi:NADH-quinone oxidoreductase subunit M